MKTNCHVYVVINVQRMLDAGEHIYVSDIGTLLTKHVAPCYIVAAYYNPDFYWMKKADTNWLIDGWKTLFYTGETTPGLTRGPLPTNVDGQELTHIPSVGCGFSVEISYNHEEAITHERGMAGDMYSEQSFQCPICEAIMWRGMKQCPGCTGIITHGRWMWGAWGGGSDGAAVSG